MEKVAKLTKEEALKAAAIMHAIEVESSFKMYAYHVIGHEQYISRITELIGLFQQSIKLGENGQQYVDPMQTEIPLD